MATRTTAPYAAGDMFARTFRFFVLPPGETLPWRGDAAHQVDVQLGLLDGRETVSVDGVIVYDMASMKLANEIPVMVGPKKGVVKVTTGWHLMGRVRLFIDGRSIDPVPKGAALPHVSRAEARSKSALVRSPFLWGAVAAGLSSGLTPLVMKAGPLAKLSVLGVVAIALMTIVAWGRARQRRCQE